MNKESSKNFKPIGKFSFLGMVATLIIGSLAAVIAGLIAYGISSLLSFSIPLLIPGLLGLVIALVTAKLGTTIGKCRNKFIAVSVGVICGLIAGVTVHVVDYYRFQGQFLSIIRSEDPLLNLVTIKDIINHYLFLQTGRTGFIGYLLLKVSSTELDISLVTSGVALPPFVISNDGLFIYWFVELILIAVIAGGANSISSQKPLCEHCNAVRLIRVPVVGTDSNLADVIKSLQTRNISNALKSLTENSEGNIVRLAVEYCPGCFDSSYTNLVATEDAGPKTWIENTVWTDKLDPFHIKEILEFEEELGNVSVSS